MNSPLKVGSLFDGSGTMPLAGQLMGFTPTWASEIESYPMAVTRKNFPDMKHVGSILDIDGAQLEPVDIICGGSPCQDLSVAGKQKGLIEGERSNLFFEMTRVISEMREATHGEYPRFVIWENVPGAFSSNSGFDFLAVLQNYAALADPLFEVGKPKEKNGKLLWEKYGEVKGEGWSLAWRTVDAQYWGVPQRRRRIWLVMDFASENAGKILFDENGEGCTGEAPHEPVVTRLSDILQTDADPKYELSAKACQGILNRAAKRCKELPAMLKEALIEVAHQDFMNDLYVTEERERERERESCNWDGTQTAPTLTLNNAGGDQRMPDKDNFNHILEAKMNGNKYVVRRLTPLECCRLQGFPDDWCEGVPGSESAQYKMWGNGMALLNALHVMRGIRDLIVDELLDV